MQEIIKNENTEREEKIMIKLDLIQSRRFGRICYGFGRDENGLVYVKEDEAEVVKTMFSMSINGHSLQDIQSELFRLIFSKIKVIWFYCVRFSGKPENGVK